MRFPAAKFDSPTLNLMEQVFDDVCEEARTLTPSESWPQDVEHALAVRILAAVTEGERDHDRLRLWALNALDARHFQPPGLS